MYIHVTRCVVGQGALGTKEIIMHEVARGLDLQPNRFCLLAALLGSFLLTDDDLTDFHESLLQAKQAKVSPQCLLQGSG